MQSLRRGVLRSSRNLHKPVNRLSRRLAHDSASSTSNAHVEPAGEVKEHFGKGFYIALGSVPVALAAYKFTTDTDDEPYLSRLIHLYTESQRQSAERNELHTKAIERAGEDRILFLNQPRNTHYELAYPEQFNHGAPWNVRAGHGHANLDAVVAKYQREFQAEEEAKLKALQERTLDPVEADPPPTRT